MTDTPPIQLAQPVLSNKSSNDLRSMVGIHSGSSRYLSAEQHNMVSTVLNKHNTNNNNNNSINNQLKEIPLIINRMPLFKGYPKSTLIYVKSNDYSNCPPLKNAQKSMINDIKCAAYLLIEKYIKIGVLFELNISDHDRSDLLNLNLFNDLPIIDNNNINNNHKKHDIILSVVESNTKDNNNKQDEIKLDEINSKLQTNVINNSTMIDQTTINKKEKKKEQPNELSNTDSNNSNNNNNTYNPQIWTIQQLSMIFLNVMSAQYKLMNGNFTRFIKTKEYQQYVAMRS